MAGLNIEEKDYGTPRSFRLSQENIDLLEQLADMYKTTQRNIINAMLAQYGPRLMEQAKQAERLEKE